MATVAALLPQAASAIRVDVETGEHDDGLSAFLLVRPCLLGIAYRMLGGAAEAEDIVQDVWMRWQFTNQGAVENPPAFLAKATTRLCINFAQSAHSRHETCIETWLPEQVDAHSNPESGAELGEALRHAMLALLEKLSPAERAAYILREAFDYSFRQIANVLQIGEANSRQLVSRARKHIADSRRTPVSSDNQRCLLQIFVAAAQNGDMTALERLFAEDILSGSGKDRSMRSERTTLSGALDAWGEKPFFSDNERAAFDYPEVNIQRSHDPDEVFEVAHGQFSEGEPVNLRVSIA